MDGYMTIGTGIVLSVFMICLTSLLLIFLFGRLLWKMVDLVFERIKELDSTVLVNVDKKIQVDVSPRLQNGEPDKPVPES